MAQFLEYIKMAFFNIVANKMRSALTMLGIIIGISSVILIMSLGNGAKKMISGELDSVGNGQVALMSLTDEMISLADLDAVVEQVDGIVAYRDDPSSQGTISTVKGEFSASVNGCRVDQNLFEQYTELTKGRYFNDQEFENGTHVCYMGASDAIRMFGTTDVLGMNLEVEFAGRGLGEYMVIGITDYKDSNSMMNFTYEDMPVSIYVPTTTLRNDIGFDFSNEDIYTGVAYLMLADDADAKETCNEVINVMNSRHGTHGTEAYVFQTFADYMSTINTVINLITLFISLVAAISLVVGGIGVMNIMLVSVTERTREIGVRKALGAKTGSITLQFLSESAIITMLGGILGILFGLLMAFLITRVIALAAPDYAFTPSISAGAVIGATLFSSAVGIFFGIYPARKAAKMNPIDALRSL